MEWKALTGTWSASAFENSCGCPALDMPHSREMTEQMDWRAKQALQVVLRLRRSKVLRSLRHICGHEAKDITPMKRLMPGGERRGKTKYSTVFLERMRKGHWPHCQSDEHWNCFKGNVGGNVSGMGWSAHGLFWAQKIPSSTELNWTKCCHHFCRPKPSLRSHDPALTTCHDPALTTPMTQLWPAMTHHDPALTTRHDSAHMTCHDPALMTCHDPAIMTPMTQLSRPTMTQISWPAMPSSHDPPWPSSHDPPWPSSLGSGMVDDGHVDKITVNKILWIFLRAHHDCNKTAPCGMIKVFELNWIERPACNTVASSTTTKTRGPKWLACWSAAWF